MTGQLFVIGPCYVCEKPFRFNAMTVPSAVIEGVRQPVCRVCIDDVNRQRVANGLVPMTVLPDSYGPEQTP